MKRVILMCVLVSVMLVNVFQCVAADTVYRPDTDGNYSVSYEDEKIVDGQDYSFIVIEGLDNEVLNLSDGDLDKILYIDDTKASDGSITFDNFNLKGRLPSEEGFTGGTAYVGGEGFGSATSIGTLQETFVDVADVTLDKTEVTIMLGETITLTATVTPDNATNKTVTWTSSDDTVASVDANGVVKGVAASQTPVTITATVGDKAADEEKPWDENSTHWRRLMLGTYYNMHTLGTLMHTTGTMPKKITARVVRAGNRAEKMNRCIGHDGDKMLCEMDNGAMFDITGCCYYGPTSKWFRLIGEKGMMETKRYDETEVLFASSKHHFYPDEEIPEIEHYKPQYSELNMAPKEEFEGYTEEQMRLGHGGIDFWMLLNFIKYINGTYEPFFNVYRATALSAAGILAWKSVLDNSKEYEIPDFANSVLYNGDGYFLQNFRK